MTPSTAISTVISTISRLHAAARTACGALFSVSILSRTDWCLESDVMPNSRLQVRAVLADLGSDKAAPVHQREENEESDEADHPVHRISRPFAGTDRQAGGGDIPPCHTACTTLVISLTPPTSLNPPTSISFSSSSSSSSSLIFLFFFSCFAH